ncbi:MAG: FAD binding domain-containing protein [Mesorhizobium sp.]|nr:FAD binding domain-containing protein [Mesorhizobium sp.]MCO5162707.1 FAD binding domain-containing protein [Mesorhizobium sp.]
MHPFQFSRPASLEAAKALYARSQSPVYLAGGMTMLPSMKQHLNAPDTVIDLSAIPDLSDISWEGGVLGIGALVTHAKIATNAEIRRRFPALAEVAGLIVDRHVRNRGTIGGSLANNDPGADYPAAVLAAASAIVTSDRTLTPDSFFSGLFETALEPGEIIRMVRFEVPTKAAYEKFPHPVSGYAMAGVFAGRFAGATRIAVTGAGSEGVFRLQATEAAASSYTDLDTALDADLADAPLLEDYYAPGTYRAQLVRVLVKRALRRIA